MLPIRVNQHVEYKSTLSIHSFRNIKQKNTNYFFVFLFGVTEKENYNE